MTDGRYRVGKVHEISRRGYGKALGYSHAALAFENRNSAGPRKRLATELKYVRSKFGGRGTQALKKALGR